MPFWRIYYHFVWATSERRPLITPNIEPLVYGYMIGKAHALGCIVHAIGGVADHAHLVASVPPRLAVAEFVRNVKGATAHHVNHSNLALKTAFAWQRGYGVFSYEQNGLDIVVAYVRNQKEHHQQNNVRPDLESTDDFDDGPEPWHQGEAIAHIPVKGIREPGAFIE